jgi:hypothetical protein
MISCTGEPAQEAFSNLPEHEQDAAVRDAIADGCMPESMALAMWLEQPESELLAINAALGRWMA